jgi:hypothetical protein
VWWAWLYRASQIFRRVDWKFWKIMDKQHPHFGASYKIARLTDDTFGVGVTIPGTQLVNVPSFASEELAKAWISNHGREIAAGTMARAKLYLWGKDT